jgi:hypothetical protein
MLNTSLLMGLDVAFADLRKAEDRVRGICARIAAEDGDAATESQEGPGLAQADAVRAKTAEKRATAPSGGSRRSPKIPPDPGQVDKPWQKCRCAKCGTITGSRIVQDRRLPTGHYVPGTMAVCPGRSLPAEPVTKEEFELSKKGEAGDE